MKASGTQLFNLLQGQQHFMIPLFQRPYSWDKKNYESLWNDLMEIYEDGMEERHFLGSIVTKSMEATPEGVTPFLVIDGQQRLTTLTLLLAALRDAAKSTEPQLADKVHRLYLTNEFASNDHKYKVLPTQADRQAYRILVEEGPSKDDRSRASGTYRYFHERIRKTRIDDASLDLKKLEQVIVGGLELVSITLEDADNEYRIFESLNATGTPLTQSDLLRNYFFMRLPATEHEEIYDSVWLPMQELLGGALESFFRYEYMSGGQFVREGDVYQAWKKRLDPLGPEELIERLKYLSRNARFYRRLIAPEDEPDVDIARGLSRLNRWGGQTVHTFLLNMYRRYDEGVVSAGEYAEILKLIESFLVRRFFARIPTNQLNRLFIRLAWQLPEGHGPVEATRLALSDPGRRWPRDEDFHEGVLRLPLFIEGRYKQRRLILETLEESYGSKESVVLSELSIEHVMPQTLSEEWKDALGESDVAKHSRVLHLLGNLTLTGYNSELSNSVFSVKREKLAQSNIEMNKEISRETEWTPAQIEERGKKLAERALEMWPGPT